MYQLKCNYCGKDFNEEDGKRDFSFHKLTVDGDSYCKIEVHLCVDCFMNLFEKFASECKIKPILKD